MQDNHVARRLEQLERRTRSLTALAVGATLCLLVVLIVGAAAGDEAGAKAAPTELTVTRITVVDDQGRPRVVIGQDAKDTQRISRAAGITLYDGTGAERGGFSTLEDGTVVLGMDSPVGVGAAMRDRIGLRVEKTGAATLSLINNQTGVPVRLVAEADGPGGIEFIDYDLGARKALIKRIDYKGESKSEQDLGN